MRRAFTLLEILVSSAVLVMMVVLLAQVMSGANNLWTRERGNSAAFENSSAAFDLLTRSLAQAMLNTYWGYDDPQKPERYTRKSEMHFVMGPTHQLLNGQNAATFPGSAVFFQAPFGRDESGAGILHSLLNSTGYFVQFGEAPDFPNSNNLRERIENKWRFRLYEWLQPTQNLAVYSTPAQALDWFASDAPAGPGNSESAVVGENIIGIILMAEYPDGTSAPGTVSSYFYDSQDPDNEATLNQLPPVIRVLMVAIDDASATRLAARWGTQPPPIGPPPFDDPAKFDDDAALWEAALREENVNYRIYSAQIKIRNSKWSQ